MQKSFCYKFNIFNSYETPWEGTRVCKKKNLDSIDYMRQKVQSKNLKYPFFRFDKEKSIEIFNDSGWHFNNIMNSKNISTMLGCLTPGALYTLLLVVFFYDLWMVDECPRQMFV